MLDDISDDGDEEYEHVSFTKYREEELKKGRRKSKDKDTPKKVKKNGTTPKKQSAKKSSSSSTVTSSSSKKKQSATSPSKSKSISESIRMNLNASDDDSQDTISASDNEDNTGFQQKKVGSINNKSTTSTTSTTTTTPKSKSTSSSISNGNGNKSSKKKTAINLDTDDDDDIVKDKRKKNNNSNYNDDEDIVSGDEQGLSDTGSVMDDENDQEFETGSETLNKLKLSLHYCVARVCESEAEKTSSKLPLTQQSMKAFTQFLFKFTRNVLARDVTMYAQHAKRQTLNSDDVLLMARGNPSLRKKLIAERKRLTKEQNKTPLFKTVYTKSASKFDPDSIFEDNSGGEDEESVDNDDDYMNDYAGRSENNDDKEKESNNDTNNNNNNNISFSNNRGDIDELFDFN